jgi:hypothetical protein
MRSLEKAAAKIVAEAVSTIGVPPEDFTRPYDVKRGLASGVAMASLGALGGASVGIAAFGTAISGAWVLAPVFGLVGLMAGRPGDKSL